MSEPAGSRRNLGLGLAALGLALLVLVLVMSRTQRSGDTLERAPTVAALAQAPLVDEGALPTPLIPEAAARAPVEARAEPEPSEPIVIEWVPSMGPGTILLEGDLLNELVLSGFRIEPSGEASLSGSFVGWNPANETRQVEVVLEGGPIDRVESFALDAGFRFDKLPAGTYRLAARTFEEPYAAGELAGLELGETTELSGLALVLGAPIEVRGTVRDDVGLPVADAEVRMGWSPSGAQRTTRSDQAGTYRLVGGAAGDYELSASRAGYVAESSVSYEVSAAEIFTHDFVLERGLELHGRVSDLSGVALQGVDVFLRSKTQAMNVESDAEGRFRFSPVRAGELRFYARAGGPQGQANSACCVVQVMRGVEPPELELVLAPSAEIRGMLVDDAGARVAGVEVVARAVDNGNVTRTGTSAVDGAFLITGLYDGTYELVVATNAQPAPRVTVTSRSGTPSVVVSFTPIDPVQVLVD